MLNTSLLWFSKTTVFHRCRISSFQVFSCTITLRADCPLPLLWHVRDVHYFSPVVSYSYMFVRCLRYIPYTYTRNTFGFFLGYFLDILALKKKTIVFYIVFWFGGRFPSLPMILPRIRSIVGDAGFEPRTSAAKVWCATNEPLISLLTLVENWYQEVKKILLEELPVYKVFS